MIENLIDPAHVHISHDRTPGGGKRENAEPYEIEVDASSMNANGFVGRYRGVSQAAEGLPFTEMTFEAPGIIRSEMGKSNTFK